MATSKDKIRPENPVYHGGANLQQIIDSRLEFEAPSRLGSVDI